MLSEELTAALVNYKVPKFWLSHFKEFYDKDERITVTYKVVDKTLILIPTHITNGVAPMPNPIKPPAPPVPTPPQTQSTRLRELDLASQVQVLEARYTTVLQQRKYLAACTEDDTPDVITVNHRTMEVSQKLANKIIALCDKELSTLEDARKAELARIDKLLEAAITWE